MHIASSFLVDYVFGAIVTTATATATSIISVLFATFVTTRPIVAFRLLLSSFSTTLEQQLMRNVTVSSLQQPLQ